MLPFNILHSLSEIIIHINDILYANHHALLAVVPLSPPQDAFHSAHTKLLIIFFIDTEELLGVH